MLSDASVVESAFWAGSGRRRSADGCRLPVGLLDEDYLLEEGGGTADAFDGVHECVLVLDVERPVVADRAEGVDEVGPERRTGWVAESERHVVPGTVACPLDRQSVEQAVPVRLRALDLDVLGVNVEDSGPEAAITVGMSAPIHIRWDGSRFAPTTSAPTASMSRSMVDTL